MRTTGMCCAEEDDQQVRLAAAYRARNALRGHSAAAARWLRRDREDSRHHPAAVASAVAQAKWARPRSSSTSRENRNRDWPRRCVPEPRHAPRRSLHRTATRDRAGGGRCPSLPTRPRERWSARRRRDRLLRPSPISNWVAIAVGTRPNRAACEGRSAHERRYRGRSPGGLSDKKARRVRRPGHPRRDDGRSLCRNPGKWGRPPAASPAITYAAVGKETSWSGNEAISRSLSHSPSGGRGRRRRTRARAHRVRASSRSSTRVHVRPTRWKRRRVRSPLARRSAR